MSKTVDERVVKMQFDNQQFEQGVKTTMSSLAKFKQALKLDGATKGLESVDAAAKKVNMSGLGDSIEAVRLKFSALEVMGVTALSNITNEALNAGKKVVKAFTIDPVKSGFQEYETQINVVQTILANTSSKGTTLDQVNNALGFFICLVFFTELFGPNGNACFGYTIFSSKTFEGSSLFKMKTDNLLLEFWFVVLVHL